MQQFTSKTYFNSLNILHLMLCFGTLMALGIFYFTSREAPQSDEELASLFKIVVPVVAVSLVGASLFLPKKLIGDISDKLSLADKLHRYRSALIIKFALLEGGAIFGGVTYFLTKEILFFGIGSGLVIFMLLSRPSKTQLIEALQLSGKDRDIIESENEEIPGK